MGAPDTIAGWVGLILAILTIISLMAGLFVGILKLVIRLAKQHIASNVNATINAQLAGSIREAVASGIAPVGLRLEAINTQLVTQDGELSRVLDRTISIEKTINNGLCDRQERIENKMDSLIEHLLWDGNERRVDEQ